MSDLLRELAPLTPDAWALIDAEAERTLRELLIGRRFVDFVGPIGWGTAVISSGAVSRTAIDLVDGVDVRCREAQPLLELRAPFDLPRDEVRRIERGGTPNLDRVVEACRRAALAEDVAIFEGAPDRGVAGIASASVHDPVPLPDDYTKYPAAAEDAVQRLRDAGVSGPFGMVLETSCYEGLVRTTDSGHPVIRHLGLVLDGPVLPSPSVPGAVVLSGRGGDFELVSGADFAVGYDHHDREAVALYVTESFALRIAAPEAAVRLVRRAEHPTKEAS